MDPAWEALTQPGASAGLGFHCGAGMATLADSNTFPDDKGYCMNVNSWR